MLETAAKLWKLRYKVGTLHGAEIRLTPTELLAFASMHTNIGERPEEAIHRTAREVAGNCGVSFKFEDRRYHSAIVFSTAKSTGIEDEGRRIMKRRAEDEKNQRAREELERRNRRGK